MYQLEETIYFYVLALVPLLFLFFLGMRWWQYRTRKSFAHTSAWARLAPNRSVFKPWLKWILLSISIICLSIGLVNPRIGTKMETVKREGLDLVFVVDVSKSMLAEDIAPNRLEKSKRIVSELMNQLTGDRVGIVAYAAQAFPLLPITTDYGAARMYLQSLDTDMLSSQGTAIADALRLAGTYFSMDDPTNRVVVLLSDGEDHEQGLENVLNDFREKGIRVYTIGVGTQKGGPIPLRSARAVESFKKDPNGDVVITKLQESVLQGLAEATSGGYLNGQDTSEAVSFILSELETIDRTEMETRQFADFKDQFQWFLGAALAFLFLDSLVFDRKTSWLKKLNLFNESEDRA